jgi:hypothetical protein
MLWTSTPRRVSIFISRADQGMQQRVQLLVGGRTRFGEDRPAMGVAAVHPVQHQAVQVDVEIGGRAQALDQRDGTALAFVTLQRRVVQQMPLDHALHHLQHRRDQLGLCGQQHAQLNGQRQHPLPHRRVRDDGGHQVRRRLRHPACSARRAEAAPLATEGQQLVVAAFAAAQPQEAVGQDAAFEEGVECFGDESRQRGPGAALEVGDEAGSVLLHQAVQRGLLGAVAFVVQRSGWGGMGGARRLLRRPPAGHRHGGGAVQSGTA